MKWQPRVLSMRVLNKNEQELDKLNKKTNGKTDKQKVSNLK